LAVKLSDPSSDLHREFLGKRANFGDGLDPDSYASDFTVDKMSLELTQKRPLHNYSPLLVLDRIGSHILLSQWPHPWLAPTQFLAGDPNAPLLAIRTSIGHVEITERLEVMHQLLSMLNLTLKSEFSPVASSTSFCVPRVAFTLSCGQISASLARQNPEASKNSFVVQLGIGGFACVAGTEFAPRSRSPARSDTPLVSPEPLPLQMDMTASLLLQPAFIRIHGSSHNERSASNLVASDVDSHGNSMLSLGAIEINVDGHVHGSLKDEGDNLATIDPASAFFDIHCTSDRLVIELWHSAVFAAILDFLSLKTPEATPPAFAHLPSILSRFPFGISATASIAQLVLFVTNRDLNPNSNLDTSLGFALRTGVSLQYCALRPIHSQQFKHLLVRWQTRHKLYLPEERIVEAITAAKASTQLGISSAFAYFSLWETALRNAASTCNLVDDPSFATKVDPAIKALEYLRIRELKVEIALSEKHGHFPDVICQVAFHVPYIWGMFKLAHAYSFLLAAQSLKYLFSKRLPRGIAQTTSNNLSYRFRGTIKVVQLLWHLPKQNFITRIDAAAVQWSEDEVLKLRLEAVKLWVPPLEFQRPNRPTQLLWDELLHMFEWNISFRHSRTSLSLSVEGDTARIRIPNGYVISELISDAVVSFKCVRHLAMVIREGQFSDIPRPEKEVAKVIPELALRVRCLCAEACDDPLEGRLSVIWRAGLEAAKQRVEREDAFRIKAATISVADSPNMTAQIGLDSDYQFSTEHSVSIKNARDRLLRVHAIHWRHVHERAKEDQSNGEETALRQIRRRAPKRSAAHIRDLVDVAPVHSMPPLFRVMLLDACLVATPPPFSPEALSDFLFIHGKGLPRETVFSLLLPMHLSFTASSIRATMRDYPLPLLAIPPPTNGKGPALKFDSEFVVAEELGDTKSTDWVECTVIDATTSHESVAPFSILVPKTAMPVKTYASPVIQVTTDALTTLSWGVSYSAAAQDLMKVAETLSTPSRDLSPALGFWDKVCR
jgi:hypothetical protein